MKVLVVHNLHRKGSVSGDDQVFMDETVLLEQHGISVLRHSVQNDEFDSAGKLRKIGLVFGMLWSCKHYKAISRIVKKEKPDIVHVHTFFPLLSPSIFYAAKRNKAKTVVTLHDTRFICPCATSLRGNEICNKCGDGRYIRMVKYGCFKGSRLQSLIVAMCFKYHRIRKSFYNQIDKYIVLNDEQIRLLKSIGYDEKKIVKKYNFVEDKNSTIIFGEHSNLPDRYVVFYGRIGEEKGIHILMKIWNELSDIPLVIMGRGPLEDELNLWAENRENIYYLGYVAHDKCLAIVKNAEFVVFPSIWYEGCSMVEIETESMGKALIATDLGFSSEAIVDGYNGFKIKLGDVEAFRKRIVELWFNPVLCDKMGKNAREDYENKYIPEDNYKQLMSIYSSLIY